MIRDAESPSVNSPSPYVNFSQLRIRARELEKTYVVVGIVADGPALVSEAIRFKPDIAVVDIGMPLLNGLDAAWRVRDLVPNVRFVFLTIREDPNLAAATLELGTVGFVLKHSASRELLTAIEYVLRNESYLTPRLRTEDWIERKARVRQFSKALTARQRDVVQLFAEGCSMKQIPGHLNLSPKTVEFHKHHIMQSFNLKSQRRPSVVSPPARLDFDASRGCIVP